MKFLNFIRLQISGLSTLEKVFFPFVILFILLFSLWKNDSFVAIISAICGITYTIFAGKGRVVCYIFGLVATICYSYLAFASELWGNLTLNLLYYFPASIVGIFLWNKNLKENKQEIKKTSLNKKERIFYFFCAFACTVVVGELFKKLGGAYPSFDAFTTVFSVLGMLLTIKRCIEQWYVWFFVNVFSVLMWLGLYLSGVNCLAVVLKWFVYSVLAVYFLIKWTKELKQN